MCVRCRSTGALYAANARSRKFFDKDDRTPAARGVGRALRVAAVRSALPAYRSRSTQNATSATPSRLHKHAPRLREHPAAPPTPLNTSREHSDVRVTLRRAPASAKPSSIAESTTMAREVFARGFVVGTPRDVRRGGRLGAQVLHSGPARHAARRRAARGRRSSTWGTILRLDKPCGPAQPLPRGARLDCITRAGIPLQYDHGRRLKRSDSRWREQASDVSINRRRRDSRDWNITCLSLLACVDVQYLLHQPQSNASPSAAGGTLAHKYATILRRHSAVPAEDARVGAFQRSAPLLPPPSRHNKHRACRRRAAGRRPHAR